MDKLTLNKIATIYNGYNEKFGVPRQSGLVDTMESVIIFEKEYQIAEAVRGLEDYSHIWLIWRFSETGDKGWHPTVRPPRLGGNKRIGVFATRSPFRPNPIGLSSVKLIRVEKTEKHGIILRVSGADIMDGTPILDIKPYLAYTDSHPDAVCGFVDSTPRKTLNVKIPHNFKAILNDGKYEIIKDVLSQDPRPSYIEDQDRIYAVSICGLNIKFKVTGDFVLVLDIQ